MKVMDGDWILHNVVADIIRPADRDSRLYTAAGHPHRERPGMMIAAKEFRALPFLVHGRAAELATPNHERAVQQARAASDPSQARTQLDLSRDTVR